MKLALIAFAFLGCGIAAGERDRPKQVRVSLQFIEVAHPMLTDMLAGKEMSGQALHEKALALSKEGKAEILETCMVVCRSGQKATLESIREEIFPTEYGFPQSAGPNSPNVLQLTVRPPKDPILRAPTAFDTRNTGVTFEVETNEAEADRIIFLRFKSEVVSPVRLDTWMEHLDSWGDASIRMPVYETWKLSMDISVKSGRFELVSAITPKPSAPIPAVSRKILAFVRADILPVPASP